jgi:hypothetical protein
MCPISIVFTSIPIAGMTIGGDRLHKLTIPLVRKHSLKRANVNSKNDGSRLLDQPGSMSPMGSSTR